MPRRRRCLPSSTRRPVGLERPDDGGDLACLERRRVLGLVAHDDAEPWQRLTDKARERDGERRRPRERRDEDVDIMGDREPMGSVVVRMWSVGRP